MPSTHDTPGSPGLPSRSLTTASCRAVPDDRVLAQRRRRQAGLARHPLHCPRADQPDRRQERPAERKGRGGDLRPHLMKARCATLARGINPARQGSTPTYTPPSGWLFYCFFNFLITWHIIAKDITLSFLINGSSYFIPKLLIK